MGSTDTEIRERASQLQLALDLPGLVDSAIAKVITVARSI